MLLTRGVNAPSIKRLTGILDILNLDDKSLDSNARAKIVSLCGQSPGEVGGKVKVTVVVV